MLPLPCSPPPATLEATGAGEIVEHRELVLVTLKVKNQKSDKATELSLLADYFHLVARQD